MSWTKLGVIALVVVGLLTYWMTHQIWAASFLGVLFAISINGPAEWLRERVRMPAWLSTVVVMLVVLGVFAGLGAVIGPSLGKQVDEMSEKLPEATQKAADWLDERPWGRRIVARAEEWAALAEQEEDSPSDSADGDAAANADAPGDEEADQAAPAGPSTGSSVGPILRSGAGALSVTIETAALMMLTLALTIFVALDPTIYRRGVLWLVPKQQEALARKTMDRLVVALRWWMLGRIVSMAVIGVLTSLGMWMIGMPAPIALGVLAGLLSFVPNIGPIVAAVPGLLLALTVGPWMVVWALCVYIGAQIVESNVISPIINQYAVSLAPALLLSTQFIFAVLGGVWGAIIATPALVVFVVLVQQLYVREGLKKPIEVTGSE